MTSRLTRSSSDSSYESYDSLSNPKEFAKKEWVRAFGEPKSYEEYVDCEEYGKSQVPKKKDGCCNIL